MLQLFSEFIRNHLSKTIALNPHRKDGYFSLTNLMTKTSASFEFGMKFPSNVPFRFDIIPDSINFTVISSNIGVRGELNGSTRQFETVTKNMFSINKIQRRGGERRGKRELSCTVHNYKNSNEFIGF
jgi:hypothetical protein